MQTPSSILVAFSAAVALSGLAQGLAITNCDNPHQYNLANDECQNWTDKKFNFASRDGCTLSFFTGGNCDGDILLTTATQNQCITIDGQPRTMKCVV